MASRLQEAVFATEKLVSVWNKAFQVDAAAKSASSDSAKLLYHIEQLISSDEKVSLQVTWTRPKPRDPVPDANARLLVTFQPLSSAASLSAGSVAKFQARRVRNYIPGTMADDSVSTGPNSLETGEDDEKLAGEKREDSLDAATPLNSDKECLLAYSWEGHQLEHRITVAQLSALDAKLDEFLSDTDNTVAKLSKERSKELESLVGSSFLMANPLLTIQRIVKSKRALLKLTPSRDQTLVA